MRTKFEYLVCRDLDGKIDGRSVQITFTAKTTLLAEAACDDLEKYLSEAGYNFSGCPWSYEEIGEYGDSINDIYHKGDAEEEIVTSFT